MIKIPPYLQKNDLIGLVCPAGYMAKEKVQTCIDTLTGWGYRVQVGNTVGSNSVTYFSGSDEERLADFQQLLDNEEVKAILCARGGYGMGRIIDNIDFRKFKKHPKWIIGYSDITVLHCHLYSNYHISSLHAPMAAAFNEEGFKNQYVLSLKDALEGKKIKYQVGVHNYNRRGQAVGELVGGNLALLAHLVGSDSYIKTRGRILFIEDIGEYLYNIDRMLTQLKKGGKLSKLAGLLVGSFTDMKDTDRPFGQSVEEIIMNAVGDYGYPVCFGFPVGHTDENYALKIGTRYKLKVGKTKVVIEE